MTFDEMWFFYNKFSGAHKYIVGFVRNAIVYYVILNFVELAELTKFDRSSAKRGAFAKVRIYVKAKKANEFITTGRAIELCKVEELIENTKYNKGENFERIITETLTSEIWVKDNIPFWVKGDINVNGEEIQVKLNGAELTNEKALKNHMAAIAA